MGLSGVTVVGDPDDASVADSYQDGPVATVSVCPVLRTGNGNETRATARAVLRSWRPGESQDIAFGHPFRQHAELFEIYLAGCLLIGASAGRGFCCRGSRNR